MLSAAMMLRHLRLLEEAELAEDAVLVALEQRLARTRDIAGDVGAVSMRMISNRGIQAHPSTGASPIYVDAFRW